MIGIKVVEIDFIKILMPNYVQSLLHDTLITIVTKIAILKHSAKSSELLENISRRERVKLSTISAIKSYLIT